ncbi:putative PEP-binding protein [Micromonospora sp. WMMD987]|uniref:putative PEP-binding protein n=1 Tax=Micromonospora TaxID=1873 RepID=UPI00249A1FC5|nr:putative PEP-binding protein [Micromonospora sp. WMMD987]WFE95343.1 PEP-utilizing enzyme [Micromonospora sp. WMMD987]
MTGAHLLRHGGRDLAATAAGQPWGAELAAVVESSRRDAGQPVRVEFTVRAHRLRVVAVTPLVLRGAALLSHVTALLDDGTLTGRDALGMIGAADLARVLAPAGRVTGLPVLCHGRGVAPGVAGGVAVFSADAAVAARRGGADPVLILPVTRPQDLPGLLAAAAVVTEQGGDTSHAAVVTRGLGRVCVTALRDARVDPDEPCLLPDGGEPVRPGDRVTVDGSTGTVHRGDPPTTPTGRTDHTGPAVSRILAVADRHARLAVRVNADSPADAEAGRRAGATGIGLCRIEHMLLGARQPLLARVLTGTGSAETSEALDRLRDVLRDDFVAMLRAMDGLPVAIRLLDPPRHEFLPDLTRLEIAAAEARVGGGTGPDPVTLAAARRLHETNPMLGVRGIRLGVLDPRLLAAQLTALVEAARLVRRDGGDPRPELLVPMVTVPAELDLVRDRLAEAYERCGATGTESMPVGAMIETPRAALVAGELARRADFLSIGSNDLTALGWGLCRDDAERELLPRYRDLGLVDESPTVRWDDDGVGELVRHAVTAACRVRPDIGVGICGEHALDPAAVRLLVGLGAHYVSCSPARLPVARLTVGQVTVAMERGTEGR